MNRCGTVRQVTAQAYWASRLDRRVVRVFMARRIARTRAINSGATVAAFGSTGPSASTAMVSLVSGSSFIVSAFVLVSGTRTHRSRTSEVSFRSFDAGRMLDQSRWHRHCPGVRARRGPFVGSGWSAGSFGWSLRPMLGEGVPLSGPIRGQTRPKPVPCARGISAASQAAFRTMLPNTPRAAGRGAAGGDARRRGLKCYARRDFGPREEGPCC